MFWVSGFGGDKIGNRGVVDEDLEIAFRLVCSLGTGRVCRLEQD